MEHQQPPSTIIPEFRIYNRYHELERRERERKELAWEKELQIAMDLSEQSDSQQMPTCQSCPKLLEGCGESPKLRKMPSYDSCCVPAPISETRKSRRRASDDHVAKNMNNSSAVGDGGGVPTSDKDPDDVEDVRNKLQNIEFIDRTPSPSERGEET